MSPRDYLLYACVIFGWSTSWLPLKGQVGFVAPEVSVLWRFIIAAALCFLIARLQGLKLAFPARLHLRFAALGLMLFSTNFTLFYYASPHLASGLLAVVFSTASLLNILMLACLSRSAPPPRQLLASVIGLGGIVLIFFLNCGCRQPRCLPCHYVWRVPYFSVRAIWFPPRCRNSMCRL